MRPKESQIIFHFISKPVALAALLLLLGSPSWATIPNAGDKPPAEKTKALQPESAQYFLREAVGTDVQQAFEAEESKNETNNPLESLWRLINNNGPAPLPNVVRQTPVEPDAQQVAQNEFSARGRLFSSRSLMWPMRGGQVTSRFGWRGGRIHQGTDISAPYGTPILAAADGVVTFNGWESGYGKLVIIDHGNGVKTKYGHCAATFPAVGESIQQGQRIGLVGTTGHATGPHLHYEVVRSGVATNPEIFTRRR